MRSSKSRSRNKSNRQRTLVNVVNRVFDSSGPEGKVRGTPQQIIEKYTALARDAQLSNDRVAEQSFMQHAEHYTRMLGEALREQAERQQHQPQQQNWNGQQNGREDDGDERGQPHQQPRRDDQGERQDRQQQTDRNDRGERQQNDRNDRQDRGDRQQTDRQDRGERQDRGDRQDRDDRPRDRHNNNSNNQQRQRRDDQPNPQRQPEAAEAEAGLPWQGWASRGAAAAEVGAGDTRGNGLPDAVGFNESDTGPLSLPEHGSPERPDDAHAPAISSEDTGADGHPAIALETGSDVEAAADATPRDKRRGPRAAPRPRAPRKPVDAPEPDQAASE